MDQGRLRRRLILALGLALAATPGLAGGRLRVLVQRSPLAGFQYHAAPRLWSELRRGEALSLRREAENPHDPRAIAVFRGADQLGYLPRAENDVVSQAMDEGRRLDVRIAGLRESGDPWQRVELEVFLISDGETTGHPGFP
ncbi:HIRAN domain-containing protein [Niveibacterium sp. SC-1]|uniref:HIRAN domain-containing protein n=1 Tax=Niveibacterium sp. SC-1 TaxID=3135646 RepID=UPI00311FA4B8